MSRRARTFAAAAVVALAVAGCGSEPASSRGSLGGIGLFHPNVAGHRLAVDFAVATRFPNADDGHAERDRRFDWVSLRLTGRTVVATHRSQRVYKASRLVDTDTHGLSMWRDRWRAVLPATAFGAVEGRTPMTVRACDEPFANGVHCETRTIDVCVRGGRLVGEVTTGDPPSPSILGADGDPRYADYDCREPVFNGPYLTALSDSATGWDRDP